MQAIFTDIIEGDAESVRARIEKDPTLVNAVATGSPKKYVGQSALQVAIRTGEFAIARELLDKGSDPNFSDVNPPDGWVKTVLHDAAVAAVMRSRWSRRTFNAQSEQVWKTVEVEKHDESYELLVALIDAGAVVTATDSMGATPFGRAIHAAHDVLPRRNDEKPEADDGKPLTPELVHDITRIFALFTAHDADATKAEPQFEMPLADFYRHELVGKFLAGTVEPDEATA